MKLFGYSIRKVGKPIMYAPRSMPASLAAAEDARLKRLVDTAAELRPPHDPEKIRDESRKTIALTFVFAFVGIVAVVLIAIPIYNAMVFSDAKVIPQEASFTPIDISSVLTTVGTILGTPLGFVVGYYFKEERNTKHLRGKTDSK